MVMLLLSSVYRRTGNDISGLIPVYTSVFSRDPFRHDHGTSLSPLLSVECYFLPAKRTLAVKALRSPPESWPKLGASTLFAMTLGFYQLTAFTISMCAAHKYPRKANFFSSAKFRFL